jgi:predicted amidohydrolase YtcJ
VVGLPALRGKHQGLDRGRQSGDLVILSDNPMTIEPAKIVNIKVLETIKSGKSIYKRPAQ